MRFAAPVLIALTVVAPASRADDDFFEKKIRPVLTEHCLKCHSAEAARNKKLKAGLYLDTRDGVRTGGDTGPSLVPGKPAESLLLKTLKYDGDTKMPPAGKLPDAVVADFEKWIAMGAPDPRAGTTAKKAVGMSLEAGRNFWSYKPVRAPAVPAVKGADWPLNDIDRFVLAKLEEKGIAPAPEADRPTLIRRVHYALVGLPPSPEEVDAFVADRSPDAYEKVVDRLLASPAYGEKWGRHWLDVARFGESLTLRGFILKEAWRYRDYVIDSFNADVTFDRFIREQIAGDLIPAGTSPAARRRRLIATTYLALGNTNLEEQDKKQLRMDVVDEQLDVITKGFLAQTVTCARCHDHKFDPIPTRDYYALAGILRNAKSMEHANVSKWIEVPLPADPAEEARLQAHEAEVAKLQARIKSLKGVGTAAAGVLAVKNAPGIVIDDADAKKVGEWQHSVHNGTYIGSGYSHDQDKGKGEKTLTFQPEALPPGRYEVRLAYTHGGNRSPAVPVTVMSADGEKEATIDMTRPPPVDGRYVSLGEFRFEKNGLGYVIVSNEGTKGHVIADAVVFLPQSQANPERERRGGANPGARAPGSPSNELASLETQLKRLQETGPKRQMVMTVLEEPRIEDARVHVRGSVHNLGEAAPRGFLRVATPGAAPAIPAKESGRKELAEWIASPDNPLTARVFVNRAWHWLLGSGIVRTVDNFGTTGETPSHPELLDHLAARFVADGWSVKQLVRTIVLSRTFRLSSATNSRQPTADADNQLFGRANRRRLDAEEIRDTMLVASGKLSPERGGPTYPATLAADYGFKPADTRRSVYAPVFRNAMPEVLEVFDFADTSVVTGRRNVSTVAPQALFLMNHPFPAQQAKFTAERLLKESHADDGARLVRVYRLTLGRLPNDGERAVAKKYLDGKDAKAAWAALIQALFASADFRYLD